jgi:hypothetical protein
VRNSHQTPHKIFEAVEFTRFILSGKAWAIRRQDKRSLEWSVAPMCAKSQLRVIEHLARSIWLAGFRTENLIAMFSLTSYFDASGGVEHPAIIVAGYISSVRKWERFDVEWRKVLARREFNVRYFHMKEFAHSTDEFDGWKGDEPRRRRFINALIVVLSKYAHAGFACMVKDSIWDSMNRIYPLAELYGCPYALCGRDCVNKSYVWGWSKNYSSGRIRTVFDDGEHGKGHLMRVVQEAEKATPMFEHAMPHTTNDFRGVTPLQAADFAAWELLKSITSGKEHAPFEEYRVSLQKLSKAVPVSWTQYLETDIAELCRRGGIVPRAKV